MPGARRTFPRPLAALLAAATLLSLGWVLFTPALQGPDETGHVAYIQHLAETGHGPVTGDTPGGAQSAELQALTRWRNLVSVLGLATAHPGWSDAEIRAWERDSAHAARGDGAGPNALAQNPPAYYVYDAVAYDVGSGWSLPTRLLLMRLANIPILWVLIVAAWVAMGELFPRRAGGGEFPRVVGTGAVALLPMVTFMGAVINPDIALAAVSSAAIALSLVGLRKGPQLELLLGLGALGGLGVLVHGRGLALLPAIVVVIAALLWRARRDTEIPRARQAIGTAGALAFMAIGLILAIVYSNDHASGTSLTGELSGSSSSGVHDLSGFFDYVWQFYFSPLTDMKPLDVGGDIGYRQIYVEQFIGGAFGSLDVRLPTAVYRVLEIAQAVGLLVLLGAIVARWDVVRRHLAQVGVLVLFFVCTLGLLHVAAWQDLSEAGATLMAGRYLLPLVIVFGAAVGFVVAVLPRRLGVALGATILSCGAVLTIGGIAMSLVRFNA